MNILIKQECFFIRKQEYTFFVFNWDSSSNLILSASENDYKQSLGLMTEGCKKEKKTKISECFSSTRSDDFYSCFKNLGILNNQSINDIYQALKIINEIDIDLKGYSILSPFDLKSYFKQFPQTKLNLFFESLENKSLKQTFSINFYSFILLNYFFINRL